LKYSIALSATDKPVGSKSHMKKIGLIIGSILIVVTVTGLLIFRRSVDPLSFAPKSFSSSAFTCKICGSTKYINSKYILGYIPMKSVEKIEYKAPNFSSCSHEWENGISSAYPNPIADSRVVLVRKSGKYGAFILRNQSIEPERAEYEWWYQADGSGKLNKSLNTVSTGQGVTPRIRFMDFDISWSGNTESQGWIYYEHSPGDKVAHDELHICITELKTVDDLDAADPKWHYKATPVD
jgi:hypothetical protein